MAATHAPIGKSETDSGDDNKMEHGQINAEEVLEYDRYGFYGGQQYTDPERLVAFLFLFFREFRVPIKVIRSRELKWRDMFLDWTMWTTKYKRKVRDRCRKGIPDSMRCEAWQRLCCSPMMSYVRPKAFAVTPLGSQRPRKLSKRIFNSLSKNENFRSMPTINTGSPSLLVRRANFHKAYIDLFMRLLLCYWYYNN
ncbi:unnamed protein product [Protopolystoma xenopodis]|uniref:Rab-GAP TBC domain-containing protein n=1 Tax=Protopolystoma xenopodis TaxID=117903 RepID=A0A3S5AFQ9_9PLAT|nr:unnamed protein product [Protopolystoma xenopodis]